MDNTVRFLDANYVPIGQPIDTYSSLEYTEKWGANGDFKLVLSPSLFLSIKDAEYMHVNGTTFLVDNIKTKDASTNNEMSVSGRHLNAILDRVLIQIVTRIRGNLEVQVRALITSLATTGLQKVNKLALGTLVGHAAGIDAFTERGNLGKWLYTELGKRGFSYQLEYDQASDSVLFNVVKSEDRSADQTVNEPVVFSAQVGNIENVEYSRSKTDYYNFAVVYNDDETNPQTAYVDMSNGGDKRALLVSGKKSSGDDDSARAFAYVAFARNVTDANSKTMYLSKDAVDFDLFKTITGSYTINGVDYFGGTYICSANSGRALVSTDYGVTATYYDTGLAVNLYAAKYTDSVFNVAGASAKIGASYDGETWSDVSNANISGTIHQIIRANGKLILACASGDTFYWARSEYGIDWSDYGSGSLGAGISAAEITGIAQGVSGFVAVGYATIAAVERAISVILDDDLNIVSVNVCDIAGATRFNGVTYAFSRYCACGADMFVAYSTLGDTWTKATEPIIHSITSPYVAISNDGDRVFAIGERFSYALRTSDGDTWTDSLNGIPDSSPFNLRCTAMVFGSSEYGSSMLQIGAAALLESQQVEVIDGDILPNVAPLIGTDCNIGDITSIVDINRGIIATKRLVAAQTVIEPNAQYTIPKFGTDYLTLTQYIKKEIAKNV